MSNKANYLPALDGMRAISILLVLFAHLGFEKLVPGGLGVNIFFYISGLLITNLLLTEFEKKGSVNFKDFFIRRILRLYPPLLLMVFVAWMFPAPGSKMQFKEITAALFYFENYYYISHFFEPDIIKNIHFPIIWSLSIEEHFYIVFPFLFAFLIKKKNTLLITLSCIIVLSSLFRIYISTIYDQSAYADAYTYYTTLCRVDAIMMGCFSSIILHYNKRSAYIKLASSIPVFTMAIVGVLFSLVYRNDFFRETVRYNLQSVAFMLIIPAILFSSRYALLNRVLSGKVITFVGRLSYSLYLFHPLSYMFVSTYIIQKNTNLPLYCIVCLTGAFAMALISFYIVEKPMMALRRKFGSNAGNPEKAAVKAS